MIDAEIRLITNENPKILGPNCYLQQSPKSHDWKSEENLWLMDFLAPFGYAKHIANDIKKNIHPNEHVKAFPIYKSGKPKKSGTCMVIITIKTRKIR